MDTSRHRRAFASLLCLALVTASGQATGGSQTGKTPAGVSSSAHPLKRRTARPVGETTGEAAAEDTQSDATGIPADEVAETPAVLTVGEADLAAAAKISPAERAAPAIVARELELHLNTHTGASETRARVSVENRGAEPLPVIVLRVSGALSWESARDARSGAKLALEQHRLHDDLDHTGIASELALTLPAPLAPGTRIDLDLFYGGTLGSSAGRLLALGAPADVALRTDWDTVSDTFTGLRGMGHVLWYPVTGAPALLKDAASVTDAVETSRAGEAASSFHLRLTLETAGSAPATAFFNGEPAALETMGGDFVSAAWTGSALGPHTPSLFVAEGAVQTAADGLLSLQAGTGDVAPTLGEAASRVQPMLVQWLGPRPARALHVIDLPIPDAAPFSDGSLLVTPVRNTAAGALTSSLVGPLATAWLPDGIGAAWLREGIPAFLQAVWMERLFGRDAALAALASTAKLQAALEVTPAPGVSSSSSGEGASTTMAALGVCADPACARSRAAYVLEMLRGTLGDAALGNVLAGWRVAEESSPNDTASEETGKFESLAQRVAKPRDLQWFFRNWIDEARPLPELSIIAVAPRKVERETAVALLPQAKRPVGGPIGPEPVAPADDPRDGGHTGVTPGDRVAPAAGSWLVAVEVQNSGGADVEVPVTVRAGNLTNTLPLRVPAHGRATVRVPFEAEPEEVLVNDGSVPEVRTAVHRRSLQTLTR